MDVTRDLNAALFFAYTFYDKERQIYQPISDFSEYNPVLYVAKLKVFSESTLKKIQAISFQSLLRPHNQKALAIDMSDVDYSELKFEKYELPENSALASEAFYNSKRGSVYFPKDVMGKLERQLKNEKLLRRFFFEEYCFENSLDKNWFEEKLSKDGYEFTDIPFNFEESAIYYSLLCGREVDLTDLSKAEGVFLYQVMTTILPKTRSSQKTTPML